VEDGRVNSVLWNNLIDIKSGVGIGVGRWFGDNLWQKAGNGTKLYFGEICGLMA
jgi:hypothetical protein